MIERKQIMEREFDHFRAALMNEPRGHHDMVGAVFTEAIDPTADIDVIYMDGNRWINMCGHATMGCAVAAIEFGLVRAIEPFTTIKFDTPAGIVLANVQVSNGHPLNVTITNVPSFLYLRNIEIEVGKQKIELDIAYGGSFFALVDAEKIGRKLKIENIPELVKLAKSILQNINDSYKITHPQLAISNVVNVDFYEKLEN